MGQALSQFMDDGYPTHGISKKQIVPVKKRREKQLPCASMVAGLIVIFYKFSCLYRYRIAEYHLI